MTEHYFSGSKPKTIPPPEIPGSCLGPFGSPYNIMDHWASELRAEGKSILEAEREKYGPEIAEHSFGYDKGLQIPEDNWEQFIRWKELSETPQALDIVPVGDEIGIKVSARERLVEGAKYVHDSEVDVPINRVGVYVHKAENLKQAVTNYMGSGEMQQLHGFMKGKGYSITQDIDSFVVADMTLGEGLVAIAAVHRVENWLAFNNQFRDIIAMYSEAMGVDYDTTEMYVVAHEIVHLYGVNSEEKLENLLLEFYQSRANKEPDGDTEGIPKSIRSERGAYLEKARIPLLRLASMGKKPSFNIEAVVGQLFTEAKENGLSREEAEQYVDTCLEDYAKAKKTDYSDNGNIDTDYSDRKDTEASKEVGKDGESAVCEMAVDGEAATESGEGAEGGESAGEGASE